MTFRFAFSQFFARLLPTSKSVETPPDALQSLSEPLRSPLILTVHRGKQAFTLLASELGVTNLTFRGSQPVQEGEMLQIEMLLQGQGNVKVRAHVEWVLQNQTGLTGGLRLWSSEEEQEMISQFLARHRSKAR